MPYRGLILDFGGVLTTCMRASGEAFERAEGLPPGAYQRALSAPDGRRAYAELSVGRSTQEDWNRTVGALLGVDPAGLMRRVLSGLRPEPLVIEAARKARAAGVKVAMLSNSFGLTPYDPYADLGLTEDFDAMILSELEGVRKPTQRIYERTLAALGLPGPDCVFVDDRFDNLPPAEALGIRTVHHADPGLTAAVLTSLLAEWGD